MLATMDFDDESFDWSGWVYLALRNLSPLDLEGNFLSQRPYVQRLARAKYSRTYSPSGFALREIMFQCIQELLEELARDPRRERERRLLVLLAQGSTVTAASKELKLSRTYCSSTVRARTVELLTVKVKAVISNGRKPPRTKNDNDLT